MKILIYEMEDVDLSLLEERVTEIANSFFQSPGLAYLGIQCFLDEFSTDAKIAVLDELFRTKYRNRRVHASILGHDYA